MSHIAVWRVKLSLKLSGTLFRNQSGLWHILVLSGPRSCDCTSSSTENIVFMCCSGYSSGEISVHTNVSLRAISRTCAFKSSCRLPGRSL